MSQLSINQSISQCYWFVKCCCVLLLQVYGEASIIFPLLVAETFARKSKAFKNWSEHYRCLCGFPLSVCLSVSLSVPVSLWHFRRPLCGAQGAWVPNILTLVRSREPPPKMLLGFIHNCLFSTFLCPRMCFIVPKDKITVTGRVFDPDPTGAYDAQPDSLLVCQWGKTPYTPPFAPKLKTQAPKFWTRQCFPLKIIVWQSLHFLQWTSPDMLREPVDIFRMSVPVLSFFNHSKVSTRDRFQCFASHRDLKKPRSFGKVCNFLGFVGF